MPIQMTLEAPPQGVPVKLWTDSAHNEALDQLKNVAWLPITYSHVVAMPDVQHGRGATAGSVIATRKGAISARAGELGIVPGPMGTHSYIVRGRGDVESFQACAHGAGRRMSRGAAKRQFTTDDVAEQTAGIKCRKDAGVIDECRLLGEPMPAEADPTGEHYCFERGARKDTGGDGWADVWKRHCFAWKYKGRHP